MRNGMNYTKAEQYTYSFWNLELRQAGLNIENSRIDKITYVVVMANNNVNSVEVTAVERKRLVARSSHILSQKYDFGEIGKEKKFHSSALSL